MPKKPRTYSAMHNELEEIINWFESAEFDIDEAIAKYEQAHKLTKEIKDYLTKTENTVNSLKLKSVHPR